MDAELVWMSPETLFGIKVGLGVIGGLCVAFLGGLIASDIYGRYKNGK